MPRTRITIAVGLAALAAVIGTARAQAPFASRVDALRLDVHVDASLPAGQRLSGEDFIVLDQGRRRPATVVSTDDVAVNIVVLLDASRSGAGQGLVSMSSAVTAVIDRLKPVDRISLMSFSDVVQTLAPLTHDHALVRRSLTSVRSVGRTSLIDALVRAMTLAGSYGGRTMLLVCSDGLDNTSFLNASALGAVARGSDVVVYVVNTGPGEAIRGVASLTGGQEFHTTSGRGVTDAFVDVMDHFRRRYVLSVPLEPAPSPGWHDVSVTLARRSGRVHHRAGYWVAAGRVDEGVTKEE